MRRLIKRVLLTPTDTFRSAAQRLLDNAISAAIADGGTFKNSNYNATIDRVVTAMTAFGTTDLSSKIHSWVDPEYLPYRQDTGTGTPNNTGCRKLYDLFMRADYTQTLAASMPILLLHSGENYWWYGGGGQSNNNCTTPSATANRITDDIDIRVRFNGRGYNANTQYLIGKYSGAGNGSYLFGVTFNFLYFVFNQSGTQRTTTSTASLPFSQNTTNWVRVTRVSSTGVVQFFTSSDGNTWTKLGNDVSTPAGAMDDSTQPVVTNRGGLFNGQLFRVQILNGINGTLAVDLNPQSFDPSLSPNSWASATGETWTLNIDQTQTTNYKSALVYRNMIMSDGVDDNMASSNVTIGGQTLGVLASTRILNSVSASNDLIELSTDVTANNNTFRVSMGNGTNRRLINGSWSALGANVNTSNADPFTARLMLLSSLIDTSQAAASENTMFINQSSVASTNSTVTNQTFSFDTAYPLGLFGRTSRWANVSLHDLMVVTDISKRVEMENIIRSMSQNFAF